MQRVAVVTVFFLLIPVAYGYEQTQNVEGFSLTLSRDEQAVMGLKTVYGLRIVDEKGTAVENASVRALAFHQVESGFLLCTVGGKVTTRVIPLGDGAYRVETVYLGAGEGRLQIDADLGGRSIGAEFRDEVQGFQEPEGEVVSRGRGRTGAVPFFAALLILAAIGYLRSRRGR